MNELGGNLGINHLCVIFHANRFQNVFYFNSMIFFFPWTDILNLDEPPTARLFIFISFTALKERKISSLRIWIYILLCFVFLSHDSYILLLHHLEFIFHYGMRYVSFVSNVCPLFFQSSFFKMILEITLSLIWSCSMEYILYFLEHKWACFLGSVLFLWSIFFFPFSFLCFFKKIIENDF